jgi:hypothetical protein
LDIESRLQPTRHIPDDGGVMAHLTASERGDFETSKGMGGTDRSTSRDAENCNNQKSERDPAHTWQQRMAHAVRVGQVAIANPYRPNPVKVKIE